MLASLLVSLTTPALAQDLVHVGTLEVTYCWSSTTFDTRCPRTHVEMWADDVDATDGDAEVTVVILDNGQTFEDSAWGTWSMFEKVTRSGAIKDKLRIKFTGDNGVRYTGTLKNHGCYDGRMKTLPSNTSAVAVEGVFRACEL
ncbi:MAG: hypothetical protein AAF211_23560 [Myxococcota bacterium]